MTLNLNDTRRLGASGVSVPAMGVGVWAWGEKGFWGYGTTHSRADIEAAYRVSLDAGVNFFDTAEVYGRGESEKLLGLCHRLDPRPALIASKYFPLPYRFSAKALLKALDNSLQRLKIETLDLYQVHMPYSLVKHDDLMDAMAEAVKAGKIRAVGVSNFSAEQMKRCQARLERHGIPLASNQVQYSLIKRSPEVNGVLRACREMDVALIAYSPIGQGVLTDRFLQPNQPKPTGPRRFYRNFKESGRQELMPLLATVQDVARSREKSIEQVALNWLICQDELVIPIPGAKTRRQATSNAGALGWRLSDEEKARIDRAAAKYLK